jgi:hypothetical protein
MSRTIALRRIRRRALPSLLAAAATVSVAAAAVPATAAAATPARCTLPKLSAKLRSLSVGAGQRVLTLQLTNVSHSRCSLFGYPGAQLLNRAGQAVPTDVVRSPARVRTIVLAPGRNATTQLQWSAIPGPGEPTNRRCEPLAVRIEVTPPNATDHFVLPWRYGAVCERGEITVRPLR